MKSNELGSELNPVKNNIELSRAIIGKENCVIYTVNTFEVSKENLNLLNLKRIILKGLAFAQVKYIPNKHKSNRKNIKYIVLDEINNIELNINIEETQKHNYLNNGM